MYEGHVFRHNNKMNFNCPRELEWEITSLLLIEMVIKDELLPLGNVNPEKDLADILDSITYK